jgi:hypothetical protein
MLAVCCAVAALRSDRATALDVLDPSVDKPGTTAAAMLGAPVALTDTWAALRRADIWPAQEAPALNAVAQAMVLTP